MSIQYDPQLLHRASPRSDLDKSGSSHGQGMLDFNEFLEIMTVPGQQDLALRIGYPWVPPIQGWKPSFSHEKGMELLGVLGVSGQDERKGLQGLLVTQGLDLSCTHYGCHCGCHLRFPNLSVTSCNIPNCGQLHYSGGAISPRELQVVVSIWGCPTSWESHGLCSGISAGNGQLHHTPHVNPDHFLSPGCSQDGTPIN